MPRDLFIEFDYSANKGTTTIVNTNIKTSYIDDFLSEVVHSQIGAGEDKNKANERDIYNILVRCDLSYDHINISSNTGNAGLTTGIMAYAIGNWNFSDELLRAYEQSLDFIGPPRPEYFAQSKPKCTNGLETLATDGPGMEVKGRWQPCDGPGEYFEEDIQTDGPDSAL